MCTDLCLKIYIPACVLYINCTCIESRRPLLMYIFYDSLIFLCINYMLKYLIFISFCFLMLLSFFAGAHSNIRDGKCFVCLKWTRCSQLKICYSCFHSPFSRTCAVLCHACLTTLHSTVPPGLALSTSFTHLIRAFLLATVKPLFHSLPHPLAPEQYVKNIKHTYTFLYRMKIKLLVVVDTLVFQVWPSQSGLQFK